MRMVSKNMVHVKKCPCEYGRGKPTTEFHVNGRPMIYCMGWIDMRTDEPLKICKVCSDWYMGKQIEKDFVDMRGEEE